MLDAFRVGERDDAGTGGHGSSIGEEKTNYLFPSFAGIILRVLSVRYMDRYILGLVVLMGL